MIFEAYPLIVDDSHIDINAGCDETCYLNQVDPVSVKIQIINAELNFKSLFYYSDFHDNLPQMQYDVKRSRDWQKIDKMNSRIPDYNMKWVADDNDIVAKYYYEKKEMFGEAYYLCGFEYYKAGLFEYNKYFPNPKVDPNLVRSFDWRNRHGANDPASDYWDGDYLGTGWFTSVKNQTLGTCWAFSAASLTEVISNLYSNDSLDFDLAEQHLISCSSSGDCYEGDDADALNFIHYSGIVEEDCYPYNCPLQDNCEHLCSSPEYLKIKDTISVDYRNFDSLRIAIIKHGPITLDYFHTKDGKGRHAANLAGYLFDCSDSTVWWLIKNSWGTDWGMNGFGYIRIDTTFAAAGIETPVYQGIYELQTHCWDLDSDGYYYWGIGPKPENCNCPDTADCNDNNPFVGGYDENYNCSCIFEMDSVTHHITSDTTWLDSTFVNYRISIDSGACLTIRSYAAFAPEARITVLPGGQLILDSAYLTKVCPELWGGIEVWGIDTVQYFDQYFGRIDISNNSVIEFARTAVSNYCSRCSYNAMQSGGIIHAENSTFRNNERDVVLAPFKNEWDHHELPYSGVFEKCQFITTNELYDITSPVAHAEIKDIYGAQFLGCVFKNESDINFFPHVTRGTGISGIDAQFYLGKYCNTPQTIPCVDLDTCKFIGLEYGIKALNCHTLRTLNIQDLIFENNLLGISLSGIHNLSILSNDILCPTKITRINPERFIGGLFLEGCNDYHIEDNYIYSKPDTGSMTGTTSCYGIGVKNSGPRNNEIYNNRFLKLNIGIYCIGENKDRDTLGLCLKCNDMYYNSNDFVVVADTNPPSGSHQGINKYQGNPNDSMSYVAPAGNTFTYFSSPADHEDLRNYNYYNACEDIWYIHHNSENPRVVPLDSNYTRETIELKGWQLLQYQKDSACPSGIYGGGLKNYYDPRLTISEADNQISALTSQLNELVDGGNTAELNFEVMTSLPVEGLELRQQLLTESPYLSDTVMKQAIYKEDVLPNAMIRDILQANPQAAKSDEVLSTLDTRFEPMPDYMMDQIMENKNVLGAKELLEAEIQHWQQIRSKAKAELFREFLLDTNVIHPLDSVITFLENENDLQSKYDLALAYWNQDDTLDALLTLNNIPAQFPMNDRQQNDHQLFETFFGITKTMMDSSWAASDLDSNSVEILIYLMEAGSPEISAYARGLLVEGGYTDYIETIVLPDIVKSSGPIKAPAHQSETNTDIEYLRLFPNPAKDYVIVYFNFNALENNAHLTINDMQGKLLKSITIDSNQNQVVIDLKDISNGIYLISLHSGRILIDSKKLSKVMD
jgi:hypothetical protein